MKMSGKLFKPRWPPTTVRPQYEMTVIQKKRDARQGLKCQFLDSVRLNRPEEMEECIKKGVGAESCFPDGVQAILKAADNGYVEVVRLLLRHGEKIDAKLGQPEVWVLFLSLSLSLSLSLDLSQSPLVEILCCPPATLTSFALPR
jgi:hypothetical protein